MSDLNPSTRALLELGRLGDDPADAAVDQNRRALAQRLGVATLGASVVVGSTAKASLSTWTTFKSLLLGGSLLIGGAVTWAVIHPSPEKNPIARAAVPVASLVVAPPAAPAPAPLLEPVLAPRAVVERSEPSARPAPARSIKEELELVRSAQQALNRGEPRAALTLLAEHARKYPSGALWQDREASRVFATCRLGDAAGARALADAFVRRAPHSPFVDRVRGACRE